MNILQQNDELCTIWYEKSNGKSIDMISSIAERYALQTDYVERLPNFQVKFKKMI